MKKPTRTECFFMIGRLTAVNSILPTGEQDEIETRARIKTIKEIVEEACELIELLAPKTYSKAEQNATTPI